MSLFRKIFGSKPNSSKENSSIEERGKHMPKIEVPVDEKFMLEFKQNGGKFLYCINSDEVDSNLNSILKETKWNKEEGFIYNKSTKKIFKKSKIKLTENLENATYFVTTVEALVAEIGSLLISSNQIAEKKINEYPNNIIAYATTSQIVHNISEGLTGIKQKNAPKIPTNITTIKNFKEDLEESFLTYGTSAKNVYLLLLEDL
ncbi:LUD domain-containing protein [Aurantibacter sp.]|uniref:LUD domain-containing protein n=1 Tax=Aurantibacter sp. TaxID=2807103 RepID=UPI0035C7DC18